MKKSMLTTMSLGLVGLMAFAACTNIVLVKID